MSKTSADALGVKRVDLKAQKLDGGEDRRSFMQVNSLCHSLKAFEENMIRDVIQDG